MKANFFTRFSLKNPTVIFLFMAIIIAFGTYSAFNLKTEFMPNINVPVVTVSTIYPGAAPKDILENVTKPLEKALTGVKGVKKVTSQSNESVSMLIAEFDFSYDMNKAEQDIQSAVNNIKLPSEATDPKVSKISFGSFPILIYSVSSEKNQGDLEKLLVNEYKPALDAIDGVSSVEINGTTDNNIYIKLDSEKLKKYNLTTDNVKQALTGNNISFPSGEVNLKDTSLPVRVAKKITSIEDIKNIPLVSQGNPNAALGSTLASLGQGMSQLGAGLGQMGQQMGNLAKLTGTNTQGTILVAMIQQLQGDVNRQMAILNNPASTPEAKMQAQAILGKEQGMLMGYQKALGDWMKSLSATMPKGNNAQGGSQGSLGTKPKTTSSAKPSSQPAITVVHLKDVAQITTGKEKPTMYSRVNQKPALILNISKTDDANTVEIADNVYKQLDELKKASKQNIEFNQIFNQAKNIEKSVDGMLREGILGALFAVVMIALFLRNIRATLVAIVSIPLSMLITLMVLPYFNITINMLSLAGMTVAVGRVVDDSIVVIENIYRRLQTTTEYTGRELIALASQEVASAITSSTITTVAVFLPLGLVSGMIGKIFAPFAVTVVISILASLLVALTVVPMLSKMLLLNVKVQEEHEGFLQKIYGRLLTWSLKHRWVVVVVSIAVLFISLGLVSKVGVQFMPQDNARSVTVKLETKAGTSLDKTNQVAMKFEKLASATPGVDVIQTTVGSANSANGFGFNAQGSNGASFTVTIKSGVEVNKVITELRSKMASLENADTKFNLSTQSQTGTTEQVDIIVKGDNISDLRVASQKVFEAIKDVPDLANITNSLTNEKPEIAIEVDPDKAADKGLSPIMVAGMVRGILTDTEATTLDLNGKSQRVLLSLSHDALSDINKVANLEINSMKGLVKLKEIANVKKVNGPVSIAQLNGNQYASVKADVTGKDTRKASQEALTKVNNISKTLPKGVTYELSGSSENINESFTQMGLAIAVAIVMVYVVMVIAFGEAIAPFSILFALPFAAAGGLIGLFVSQQPISMSALIGILMLIGIVVTNAIVLVDRVQQNKEKGMSTHDALIEAGKIRLRPILMTAIATIMALVPLAVSTPEGALISVGLAVVVIGGLTLSTLLTLVVVPVAFSYLDQLRSKVLGKRLVKDEKIEVASN